MSALMRWSRTPFAGRDATVFPARTPGANVQGPSRRQRRARAVVAALLAVMAVMALGAWAAHAQRRSSIRLVTTAAQSRMDEVVHVVQQVPGLERMTTVQQLIDAHGSWPGGLDAPGIVSVDGAGTPDWAHAQWLGKATLRPTVRLSDEERERIRRPGAVVQGAQVHADRLTLWVMVEPRSTAATRHPWLFCGSSERIASGWHPAHLFRWVVAAALAALAAWRLGHGIELARLRDGLGDLRWRIAGLVMGTTVITCALLSVLTLDQAHNQLENERNTRVQEAVQGVLGLAQQAGHDDPLDSPFNATGGLDDSMELAVAHVRNGRVDPLDLRQLGGGSQTFFQRLPSDCLDFSTQWKNAKASETMPTYEGGVLDCGADQQVGYQIFYPAPTSASSSWVVLAVPTADQDNLQDLEVGLVMGSVVAILLASGAASRLARSVQSPVVAVRQTAERIAGGDLDARVAGRTNGELALLGGAVNQMADRLTSQIGQLEQANEHQRRFVSDVAHELRTPASALLASATALENPATRDDAAMRVVPQARRLATLTDDLLEISRLDAGQAPVATTEFDLCDLVREVARTSSRPDDVRVLAPTAVPLCLDAVRVQVVVRNLVENALRHGRPPVTVTVRCRPAGTMVEVTDEGSGVPEGMHERVFERFVQADPSRHGEGSGLGLAIARSNARLLGGDLTLDADGRTFGLHLPAPTPA